MIQDLANSLAEAASAPDLPPIWQPLPGPQSLAYASAAKWIGYGGAAGGGKSDLALGLAGTQHMRSLILRRIFRSLDGLIDRSREVYNARLTERWKDSYNEQKHRWRLTNGRQIYFGNCEHEKDWELYRGNPHDLYVFEEATEFTELMIRSIAAWNRSSIPGQRCRILLTFNPPSDAPGRWVVRFFLPWMAYLFPKLEECKSYTGRPAAPGELRYFTTVDDIDTEVSADTPGAESRTFFPASVEDNPIYMASGYDRTLDALPEPLRSQLRRGDFGAGMSADPWQVIPSDWVDAARRRWRPLPNPGRLSGVGVDVARGGRDNTIVCQRFGAWFAELAALPGSDTPNGPAVATMVIQELGARVNHKPTIAIDVIGVGAAAFDAMPPKLGAIDVNVGAGAPADATDRSGVLTFGNMRSWLWWRGREALDPETGDDLAIPPDDQLRAELLAPRYFVRSGKIWIESKDDVIKRIGRSTDRADAWLLANYPESPEATVRWIT